MAPPVPALHALSGEQQPDLTESAMNDAPPPRFPKKRTKTGCLTCRQRRIKCGEEKPTCHNCVKSKRECKGYAQRLIFKDPMGVDGTFCSNVVSNDNAQVQQSVSRRASGGHPPPRQQSISMPVDTSAGQSVVPGLADASMDRNQGPSTAPLYYPPAQASIVAQPAIPPATTWSHQQLQEFSTTLPLSNDSYMPEEITLSLGILNHSTHQQTGPIGVIPPAPSVVSRGSGYSGGDIPVTNPVPQQLTTSSWNPNTGPFHIQEQHPFYNTHTHSLPAGPSQILFDNHDHDYHDLDLDEEQADETHGSDFGQLSLIMASANREGRQLRSFATHLNEPNILASYRPTLGSSPLNNPKTARIFAHFIHSVGPSLSVFERHPVDASIVLGAPTPVARQGLWTYTLPLQALEHQALLHAILAISSLHISFLQQAPQTVSLKHYHYALKRVGSAVSLPTRRQQYGTLAATLLLGYYEVVAADHSKWNSHVAGSAQLVREIDYAGLTRDLRSHRRRVRAQREQMTQLALWLAGNYGDSSEDDPFAEKEGAIDQNFIGSITDRKVNYDEFGKVEEGSAQPYQKHFTRKDIENFRIQCDLYWWYCKQDTIQSIISGNKIFMPYYQWGQCPPRAGIGRLDAIYGSADHLWLLLGRLTDFGYRDRKRKLKATKATGGNWRPNPGFFKFMARFAGGSPSTRGPPQKPAGPASDSSGSRGAQHPGGPGAKPDKPQPSGNTSPPSGGSPPMYGMVPSRGSVRLPLAFTDTPNRMNAPDQDDDDDGEQIYSDAENEWESILVAFDTFAHALGRDFMALPPDTTPPISTPFGPALQYRTQTIAVVWGFYYTGRILLLRLHPSMPPAMMVAAGVAAPATAEYAQIIGKVTAGVYHPQLLNLNAESLSPTLGSCLIEMTVSIFFAAVQYTDAIQRNWAVVKLREVSRLTGWKSSDAIASGCERSWVVAAKQGRGPPYQPSVNPSPQQSRDKHFESDRSHERRFVTVSKSVRDHWAMGILSLEDDVLNLEIEDRV